MLEPRDVPAGYWWNPQGTADFNDPGDWMKGPGAPWAPYSFLDPDPIPGPTADVYFDGGVTTADCVIPTQSVSSGNAFAGIHLQFGYYTDLTTETEELPGEGEPPQPPPPPPPPVWRAYSGTVTLSNGFDVATLDVECGAISQGSSSVTSGNGTTLTITSALDWTGGTLNSNSVAGTIALAPGASGVAEPSFDNSGINGTVTLGSTLELMGAGTNLIAYSGTLIVTGGTGVVANSLSNLVLKVLPPKGQLTIDKKIEATPGPTVEVKAGATATVTCDRLEGNTTVATVLVKAEDGEVEFINQGTTSITSRTYLHLGTTEATLASGYAQDGEGDPLTNLQAGSAIVCVDKAGVDIRTGTLKILNLTSATGAPLTEQPPARIYTSEQLLAGLGYHTGLDIRAAATLDLRGSSFNVLDVRGDIGLRGAVSMNLSRVGDDSDKLLSSQVMWFGEPTFNLHWADDAIGEPELEVDDSWQLIDSINGITGSPSDVDYPPHQDAVFTHEFRDFNRYFAVRVTHIQ